MAELLTLSALLMGVTAQVCATQITFITGKTGAQTQIDAFHTWGFNFTVLSPWTLDTVIGDFRLRSGSSTSKNLVFTVWDQYDSYMTSGSIALGTASKTPGEFSQSFAEHILTISSLSLPPGMYSASLTSSAPDIQSEAYFIEALNTPIVADPPGIVTVDTPPIGALNVILLPDSPCPISILLGLGSVALLHRFLRPGIGKSFTRIS